MLLKLGIIFTIIVVFQLLFLALFLFTNKRGKPLSNRLLGLFFLLLALNLADLLLKVQGYSGYYRSIALLDDAFILLYGPLIYLYTFSMIYKETSWRRVWWWHFLPFLVLGIFLVLAQILNSPLQQDQMLQDIENARLPWGIALAVALTQVHPLIYLVWSFRLLRKYRKTIRDKYSNVESMNLPWLQFTLNSTLILLLVSFIHALAPIAFNAIYIRITVLLLVIFLLFFVNSWLLKALRYSALFEGIAQPPKEKYQGSSLTRDLRMELKQRLEHHLQNERSFLNADLSMDQLADSLDIPSKTLSQVINQSYDRSFFEWINSFRIKEAQRLLVEKPQATVLEILYQCGYNTKSSFNTSFKKHTGVTPSTFRLQNNSKKKGSTS